MKRNEKKYQKTKAKIEKLRSSGVSIRDIIKILGLKSPSVYYHYTKEHSVLIRCPSRFSSNVHEYINSLLTWEKNRAKIRSIKTTKRGKDNEK